MYILYCIIVVILVYTYLYICIYIYIICVFINTYVYAYIVFVFVWYLYGIRIESVRRVLVSALCVVASWPSSCLCGLSRLERQMRVNNKQKNTYGQLPVAISAQDINTMSLLSESIKLVPCHFRGADGCSVAFKHKAVAYGDEPLEIGFNAKYLLEIASQVDRENAVFLFNSAGDPTMMREGNDTSAVYVVMPMRV